MQDAPGPSGPAATMLHIQRIDHLESTRYTLDHIFDQEFSSTCIGVSYYPFWHGTLDTLQTALNDLATRYDKDLVVAETSYPWTLNAGARPQLIRRIQLTSSPNPNGSRPHRLGRPRISGRSPRVLTQGARRARRWLAGVGTRLAPRRGRSPRRRQPLCQPDHVRLRRQRATRAQCISADRSIAPAPRLPPPLPESPGGSHSSS